MTPSRRAVLKGFGAAALGTLSVTGAAADHFDESRVVLAETNPAGNDTFEWAHDSNGRVHVNREKTINCSRWCLYETCSTTPRNRMAVTTAGRATAVRSATGASFSACGPVDFFAGKVQQPNRLLTADRTFKP